MKTICLLLALGTFASAQGNLDILRQHQQETGVIWDMPHIGAEGITTSDLKMEPGGAVFQLWTIDGASGRDHLIDQKLVGPYLPQADLRIVTIDPHPTPRSRIDQSFSVQVDIGGLINGHGFPLTATTVLVRHHLTSDPGETPAEAISGTPRSQGYLSANGRTVFRFPVSSLTASNPLKAGGEEHFVIHALSDGQLSQTQIAHSSIQIWPMSDGRIEGIGNGDTIRSNTPELRMVLNDLYPHSETWLEVYPGNGSGGQGVVLQPSVFTWDDEKSTHLTRAVTRYESAFPTDGTYTIKLLTRSPFDTLILDQKTVQVARPLQVELGANSH